MKRIICKSKFKFKAVIKESIARGSFNFPTELKEGDQVWFRVNVYYPTGWDFDCSGCTEGMKFMRIHTRSSSGANEGYVHTYIQGEDGIPGQLVAGTEVQFYELLLFKQEVTILVPVANVNHIGIRPLSTQDNVKDAFKFLVIFDRSSSRPAPREKTFRS